MSGINLLYLWLAGFAEGNQWERIVFKTNGAKPNERTCVKKIKGI